MRRSGRNANELNAGIDEATRTADLIQGRIMKAMRAIRRSAVVAAVLAFTICNIFIVVHDGVARPSVRDKAGADLDRRCYRANGVDVCHDKADESVFYDTPKEEVVYNLQVIHDGPIYHAIYHSNARGGAPGSTGDSIKAGNFTAPYPPRMAAGAFVLFDSNGNPDSPMHRDFIGGGGNPMTVAGLPGDSFFYTFFVGVAPDSGARDRSGTDWRDVLLEARTKDFVAFDVKTAAGWSPLLSSESPVVLTDAAGNAIRSNKPHAPSATQGLIGSISYVNGLYHFFYMDEAASGFNLYHRTTPDVDIGVWSPPEIVASLPDAVMVRVAAAKNMSRWAVLYGCYTQGRRQDLCLQYTSNLSVRGPGGVSDLKLTSDYALGFSWLFTEFRSLSQPYWLTDRWGNLDAPGDAPANQGGEIYWSDFNSSNCKTTRYVGCPIYGGKVYRGGWTVVPPH